jgi:hypothetical protein
MNIYLTFIIQRWQVFTDLFAKFKYAAAVGPYLNCEFHPHIQSMVLALDKRGFAIMKEVFRCPVREQNETKRAWILATEVELGRRIIESGYELRTLMSVYNFREKMKSGHNLSECFGINPFRRYPMSQIEKNKTFNRDNEAKK